MGYETLIVIVFILGYTAITIEHSLKIDKLVPALLMMALAWAFTAFGIDSFTGWFDSHSHKMMEGFSLLNHDEKLHTLESTLLHHFGKTCEILIFLIGAMTIVEIIDHFDGFSTIKKYIKTDSKRKLLWIVSGLAFILSAIIDNLTATIVLITILRKLIPDSETRIWYAGLIVLAANAGGAWSPIGDVTTTMLWMGQRVSTVKLIEYLIMPSFLCMAIPLIIASFLPVFKGTFQMPEEEGEQNKMGPTMLYLGLIMIVFVPIFKTVTHLPPYVGMMLSLGVVAFIAELISNRQFSMTSVTNQEELDHTDIHHVKSPTLKALAKIELPSILFFLGILMTVASLESLGLIFQFGQDVQAVMDNKYFVLLLGVGSAIIDNVPLVAASMGMFDMNTFVMDDHIWHFIAYAAGTGGSMLIIGSAAGVVAMGMEKISFFWYLKNITWLALIGYIIGAVFFILLYH